MRLLLNPVVLRMAVVFVVALAAFAVGAVVIHRMRKGLTKEADSLSQSPLTAEGLPIDTYHLVIQQLKQQKHELTAKQLAERRRAKASDSLSATLLANLSCGVLFFNPAGLVRQANAKARQLLGFASPVGMGVDALFGAARVREQNDRRQLAGSTVKDALAPALGGEAEIRGLAVDYQAPDGTRHVLELTVSPVLADDASLIGATCVLTDKTEIASIRQEQQTRREIAAEMALTLRTSLTTISGYAQQLARSRDPEVSRQLADDITSEAAQLDRTLGGFLTCSMAAAAGSREHE